MEEVLAAALRDAQALHKGGVGALCIENFGDMPFYPERVPPEIVAAMTKAACEIERRVPLPVGVNCLRNDAASALAVAAAAGACFIRVNVHVGAAVTDQGILEGRAHETLRLRERIAPRVRVFADVHVKHAAPLGSRGIAEAARETAYRGLADGLIVTGPETGSAPNLKDLEKVREAVPDRLLLAGSGVNPKNAGAVSRRADGAIVGTYFKKEGKISHPVDPERVGRLVRLFRG